MFGRHYPSVGLMNSGIRTRCLAYRVLGISTERIDAGVAKSCSYP
jgi:hypothetical protein